MGNDRDLGMSLLVDGSDAAIAPEDTTALVHLSGMIRWRTILIPYLGSACLVLLTLRLHLSLDALVGRDGLVLFVIPIILAAYWGGLGPGLLATILSVTCSNFYLVPPLHSWAIATSAECWVLGTLFVTGSVISSICERLRRSLRLVELSRNTTAKEKEKLQSALRENGDLRTALNEHAIVAITDPQGKITHVNDKFCEISKYSRQELIGHDHRIINSGHHPAEFIRDLWTTIARGRVWHGEIKNRARDGSFYWVDTTLVPFLNEAGKPRQYVAIRADITERKLAEERLNHSTKELFDLKAALDEHAIVAITDSRGKIVYVNDKFCAISQYSREELIGQDHRIINSGYHPREFIRQLWMVISRGEVWHGEIKNRAKDGSLYWVDTTIVPFLDEEGKPRQYVAIRADITKRKIAEENLRASIKEVIDLKSALDEHAIVAITNAQGRITFVNEKFCAISKFARDELVGQDHRLINSGHHPGEFIRDLWITISHGRVWHGEIRNRAKDGSFYWVDTTIVPFLNEGGKPRQYVAIRADITERKLAEERVAQLNSDLEQRVVARTAQLESANKELEAFSYTVSHDLRAPLRAIDGFSGAVMSEFASSMPSEAQRMLNVVRKNAQRMGELIDDLLAFAQLNRQVIKRQSVDNESLVRSVLADLQPQRDNRSIEFNIHPLPKASGDPGLLRQVWVNLLANAVKYSSKKSAPVIEIGFFERAGEKIFFVRDNGCGFDMKYVTKLFGVFQRLHRVEEFEGTGVGLAIVERIVVRHGGRAWAEGATGKGAVFYFTVERAAVPTIEIA